MQKQEETNLKFWISESQSLWNQDITNMMMASVHTTLDTTLHTFDIF